MEGRFSNRMEAGRRLAEKLSAFRGHDDAIVLGLPRGGVPVAYEVAQQLGLPLDVFLVRKLGVPGYEELAMGAIASGNVSVLNEDVMRALPNSAAIFETVRAAEEIELPWRETRYRQDRPVPELHGRVVILVDDGVATGATMRAAAAALRRQGVANCGWGAGGRAQNVPGSRSGSGRSDLRGHARVLSWRRPVLRRLFADDR